MSETDKISDILKRKNIKKKYGLKRMRIFGSYSRWEQKKWSDIDLFVEYNKPLDIVLYFALKKELEDILWEKVDLINNKFLKKKFKNYIQEDLITVL